MQKVLGILLLLALGLLGAAPAASALAPAAVVVEDGAGVLDTNTLLPAVRSVDFYQPTTVAIFTYRGSAGDNLNEEVLRFARAKHPEWISPDGQKWADGLFIFALDPVGRHVGTYFGEDRKVPLDQQQKIQDATKQLFREAQWTEGTIAGIRAGAELINQPWYRSAAFIATVAIGASCLVAGAAAWLLVRLRTRTASRAALARGDRGYANVSMDLDVTELNARTIPAASSYGSMVLEKYRTFLSRYNTAAALSAQVHAFTGRELSRRRNLKLIRQYADSTAELDSLDDVIADSNALLNLASGWPEAWDRQVAPLRGDLDGLEQFLAGGDAQGASATAAALRSFRDGTYSRFEQWAAELQSGSLTPEAALDRLRDAREEFSTLLRRHSETVIGAYARNDREAELLRKGMAGAAARSDRKTGTSFEPSIIGTVYPANTFFSVHAFTAGWTAGQHSVASARGTTGYGSSGGSFSGAGSSSGF